MKTPKFVLYAGCSWKVHVMSDTSIYLESTNQTFGMRQDKFADLLQSGEMIEDVYS